jgi:riboflavin kinase/FMN adenylyltransferase
MPMQVINAARDFSAGGRKIAVAIGVFDGVHLGHQQVIRHAVTDARQHEGAAVAVTFDRHPAAVVAPQRVPPMLYSMPQKLRAIEALGADTTLVIPFDDAFSRRPGEEFVRELAREFAPLQSITVGSLFTFGFQRNGNVALLHRLGTELGFGVHGISNVALDGEPVSSTRIREKLREGDINRVSEMLGREYALCGEVVRGDMVGRKFGFPTANLDATGLALPPNGVYAVHALARGARHRAVLNIGWRPTVATPIPQPRVEAHLLNFSGDLYGAEMELTFVARLREEKKFPSLDLLRDQIKRDIAQALKCF